MCIRDRATRAARRVGGFSAYAQAALPRHQLRAIVAFRTGSTPLALHSAHHLPVISRCCVFCYAARGARIVEDAFHAIFECPLYAELRCTYFRGLPPLDSSREFARGPPTHRTILAAALSPRDAHHARMLGRFLSRLLYARELHVARVAGHSSVPHRPDHSLCARIACMDQVDGPDLLLATTAVRSWLGSDPPPSVVLCVPSSGCVYLH